MTYQNLIQTEKFNLTILQSTLKGLIDNLNLNKTTSATTTPITTIRKNANESVLEEPLANERNLVMEEPNFFVYVAFLDNFY